MKLASDFSANGTAFQIDTADANHYAVDSYDGGYVVVYQDSSSKQIRFKDDASGNAIGSETTVESSNHLIALIILVYLMDLMMLLVLKAEDLLLSIVINFILTTSIPDS